MKMAALTAMMVAAMEGAAATREVTVCMDQGPGPIGYARVMTSAIFTSIDIQLEWRGLSHCPSGALQISLSEKTPDHVRPGALAYALPYEGRHIVVFWDRIRDNAPREIAWALLANVMAHEITHILQGCSRHSSTGLMKAQWGADDIYVMGHRRLPFAPEDIDLIYRGMDRREELAELRTR